MSIFCRVFLLESLRPLNALLPVQGLSLEVQSMTISSELYEIVVRKTHRLKSVTFVFQRERVLKMRMKEKKRAKQKMANAEHKVRVATAFRGNKETDLDLQVGDEVTVLVKVRP